MEILSIQPDIKDSPDTKELIDVQGKIEFKKISFKYRAGHNYVLDDLSFSIQPGEYIALVEDSRAEKTSLCSLIPRFYEASKGEIFIDDLDIRILLTNH